MLVDEIVDGRVVRIFINQNLWRQKSTGIPNYIAKKSVFDLMS